MADQQGVDDDATDERITSSFTTLSQHVGAQQIVSNGILLTPIPLPGAGAPRLVVNHADMRIELVPDVHLPPKNHVSQPPTTASARKLQESTQPFLLRNDTTRRHPWAFFSTNGGQFAPRYLPTPKPQVIVRQNPAKDTREMIKSLRARWPHECNGIFSRSSEGHKQWHITWFFDEYDFHVLGGAFCYNLLLTIQKQNEANALHVAQDWSERNKAFYPWMPNVNMGISEMFASRDREIYGDEFLYVCLRLIRGALHRAYTAPASSAMKKPRRFLKSDPCSNAMSSYHSVPSSIAIPVLSAGSRPGPPQIVQYVPVTMLPPLDEVSTNMGSNACATANTASAVRASKHPLGSTRGHRARGGWNLSASNSRPSIDQGVSSSDTCEPSSSQPSETQAFENIPKQVQFFSSRSALNDAESPMSHTKPNQTPLRGRARNQSSSRGSKGTSYGRSPTHSRANHRPSTPRQIYLDMDPAFTAHLVRTKFVGEAVQDILGLIVGPLKPDIGEEAVRAVIEQSVPLDKCILNPTGKSVAAIFYNTADLRRILAIEPLFVGSHALYCSVPWVNTIQTPSPNAPEPGNNTQAVPQMQRLSQVQIHSSTAEPSQGQSVQQNNGIQVPSPHKHMSSFGPAIYSPQDARSSNNPLSQAATSISQPYKHVLAAQDWTNVSNQEPRDHPVPPPPSQEIAGTTNTSQKHSKEEQSKARRKRSTTEADKMSKPTRDKSRSSKKLNKAVPSQAKACVTEVATTATKEPATTTTESGSKILSADMNAKKHDYRCDTTIKEQSQSSPKASCSLNVNEEAEPSLSHTHLQEDLSNSSNACAEMDTVVEMLGSSCDNDGVKPPSMNERVNKPSMDSFSYPEMISTTKYLAPDNGSLGEEPVHTHSAAETSRSSASVEIQDPAYSGETRDSASHVSEVSKTKAPDGIESSPVESIPSSRTSRISQPNPVKNSTESILNSPSTEQRRLGDNGSPPSEVGQNSKSNMNADNTARQTKDLVPASIEEAALSESPALSTKNSPKSVSNQPGSASLSVQRDSAMKSNPGPNDLTSWHREHEMIAKAVAQVENKIQKTMLEQELEILKQFLEQLEQKYSESCQKYLTGTKSIKKTARKSLVQASTAYKETLEELVLLHGRVKGHIDSNRAGNFKYPAFHEPAARESLISSNQSLKTKEDARDSSSLVPHRDSVMAPQSTITTVSSISEILRAANVRQTENVPRPWFYIIATNDEEETGSYCGRLGNSFTSTILEETEEDLAREHVAVSGSDLSCEVMEEIDGDLVQEENSDKDPTDFAISSPTMSPLQCTPAVAVKSPPKTYAAAAAVGASASGSELIKSPSSLSATHLDKRSSRPQVTGRRMSAPPGSVNRYSSEPKHREGSEEWRIGPEGVWGEHGLLPKGIKGVSQDKVVDQTKTILPFSDE